MVNKSFSSCSEQNDPRLATKRVEHGAFDCEGEVFTLLVGLAMMGVAPRAGWGMVDTVTVGGPMNAACCIWGRNCSGSMPGIPARFCRRENSSFNNTLNTFYLWVYGVGHIGKAYSDSERGRKEMFYLTTHSTHFIYGYMASDKG